MKISLAAAIATTLTAATKAMIKKPRSRTTQT